MFHFRSNHQRCSTEKGVVTNFTKFIGKHLCQRLWHRCFPVNFMKFLRTPFLQNTSGRLLLSFGLNPFNNFCIGALAFIKNFWILWKCFLDLLFDYTIICSFAVLVTNGTKYSRIGQIKYVEDSLYELQGCIPQILLGSYFVPKIVHLKREWSQVGSCVTNHHKKLWKYWVIENWWCNFPESIRSMNNRYFLKVPCFLWCSTSNSNSLKELRNYKQKLFFPRQKLAKT